MKNCGSMIMREIVLILSFLTCLFFFSEDVLADTIYQFVTEWGSWGTGDGQFIGLCSIAVDGSGNIYVTDQQNDRIQKFDSNGNYLTQWGTKGTGNGQFQQPWGIAIDSSGNFYVADFGNCRVQKFDSSFNYLSQWSSCNAGNGQFYQPTALAVDTNDNVIISDSYNNIVEKFDSKGNYLAQWGSGQFNFPEGVAADSSGNVYVADSNNNRVLVFSSSGSYLTQWGSLGTGNGQFNLPLGVALDRSGNVYVTDINNHRVQKFDSNGNYLTQWGMGDSPPWWPSSIALDSSGNVYVVNSGSDNIQKFSPTFAEGATLTVTKAGTGTGTVRSSDSNINCGSTCSQQYPTGSVVALIAAANSGSTFTGWSGACSGQSASATCVVTMNAAKAVTANYIITGTTPFSDIMPGSFYAPYIEAIFNNKITTGCGTTGDYECISDPTTDYVTRDQMAAFLVRSAQVSTGLPPEGFTCNGGVSGQSVDCSSTTPYFSDTTLTSTNSFYFKYIQKLKELGITAGCGATDYECISDPATDYVTRDQMAAFLARAFLGME